MVAFEWSWTGAAVLFDLDGTLVDSGASVLRAWQWAAAELGRPFSLFAGSIYGMPSAQVLARLVPEVAQHERDALVAQMHLRQAADLDVVAVPGALAALDALPTKRWAIVTSADQDLALSRIRAVGLPLPRVLVTSEHVAAGKPDPAAYLLGAARLDVAPQDCLVVEDAPAGVQSGLAAGASVLGVLTSADYLDGSSYGVSDLTEVEFSADRLGVLVAALAPT